jgi:hypothetical protein
MTKPTVLSFKLGIRAAQRPGLPERARVPDVRGDIAGVGGINSSRLPDAHLRWHAVGYYQQTNRSDMYATRSPAPANAVLLAHLEPGPGRLPNQ